MIYYTPTISIILYNMIIIWMAVALAALFSLSDSLLTILLFKYVLYIVVLSNKYFLPFFLSHMVVKGKVGSIPVQFYCLSLHIKSIEIACGISDVWAGSMYWLSSKWSEQVWYELYNCFAVVEPRSSGLVFMTHFLDLLKHNDVAAREEVV